MEVSHHVINLVIILCLLAYLLYLLFFFDDVSDVKNLVTDVVSNRLGRLIVILAIVFITVDNKLKIGGAHVGVMLFMIYLLTLAKVNKVNLSERFASNCGIVPNAQNPYNPHPYRPGESALASGIPDPIPRDPEGGVPGPYADSGVSYQMDMN